MHLGADSGEGTRILDIKLGVCRSKALQHLRFTLHHLQTVMALTPPTALSPLSSPPSLSPAETPPTSPGVADFAPPGERATHTPLDVFLEITSNLYSVPFDKHGEKEASNAGYYLGERALERSNALRALSQTCKDWRRTLLPLRYQSIEAGAIVRPEILAKDQWFIQCAELLISECGRLADNPQLAWYTR